MRDEKIRVLLAASEPSYDYRYLKEYLMREKSIDLPSCSEMPILTLQRSQKPAKNILLSAIPSQQEELNKYDVVILSDVNPTLVSSAAQRNLGEYVKSHGGGLSRAGRAAIYSNFTARDSLG